MSSKDFGELLSLGAKHYAGRDYETAVGYYSELNELQETLKGESDPDYLFLYGKALYQLAVSKADLFGSGKAANGDEEEEDENEDDKSRSNLMQQQEEEEDEVEDEAEDEAEDGGDGQFETDLQNGDESSANESQKENSEPDDFESAWEILELARSLYEDKLKDTDDRELKIKLSETYDLLGEVSLEAENFQQAYQDFEACLDLRKQLYEKEDKTDRSIIESYYKLSLALEFDPNETAKCKSNLTKCMELLKERIETKDVDDDEQKDLFKELELKMKELNDADAQMDELKKSLSSITQAAVSSIGSEESKVNDLSSMVIKKKRSKGSTDTSPLTKKSRK